MSSSKKRKIADKKRVFQDKWESLYFVTEVRDTIQCLVCMQSISVVKEYNVRRHYDTLHREKYEAFTGKLREEKVQQQKASFAKQRNLFANINKLSEDSIKAMKLITMF